jgi:hypothetical protein
MYIKSSFLAGFAAGIGVLCLLILVWTNFPQSDRTTGFVLTMVASFAVFMFASVYDATTN